MYVSKQRQTASSNPTTFSFKCSPLEHLALLITVLTVSVSSVAEEPIINQLPNPEFRGTNGTVANFDSTVTGTVPTLWRAFGVTGADVTVEVVPLAANAIFPGSPATNGVRLTVNTFGANQGFDTSPVSFSLVEGRPYSFGVYLLSDDEPTQTVDVGVPIFDANGVFTGLAPGSTAVVATNVWTQFTGPVFSSTGTKTAELSFRLTDDDGVDSVVIALPEVNGPALGNLVPNPGFEGNGGLTVGSVTGPVPDFWRGFGVNGGEITLGIVPVAAGELYAGSLATNAVQLTVNTFAGGGEGLDHEQSLFSIMPIDRSLWGEVYLRSANPDNSPQEVNVALPLFNENDEFISSPGSFSAIATTSWGYFGGFSFIDTNARKSDMGFRLVESGANNSVLIALPRVNGLRETIYADGFESPPP